MSAPSRKYTIEYIEENIEKILEQRDCRKKEIRRVLDLDSVVADVFKSGYKTLVCNACGNEFPQKQQNSLHLGKICTNCKKTGGKCIICNTAIRFGGIYCKRCMALARKTELWGHSLQGSKILGKKNPAKRKDVRKKISLGVKESWEDLIVRKRHLEGRCNCQGTREFSSKLERKFAKFLENSGFQFEYEPAVKVGDKCLRPDFVVDKKIPIEVAGWLFSHQTEDYLAQYEKYGKEIDLLLEVFDIIILLTYKSCAGYFAERYKNLSIGKNVIVVTFPEQVKSYGRQEVVTITKKNICNIDYSHFLVFHEAACKQFHGHTSWNIGGVVTGHLTHQGMVVDYKEFKKIVKGVAKKLDHKLIIRSKYVTEEVGDIVVIEYFTDKYHRLELPKEEVFILKNDNEPTLEHITTEFAEMVLSKMPNNVVEVGISLTEGTSNGGISFATRYIYDFSCIKDIINFYRIADFAPNKECGFGNYCEVTSKGGHILINTRKIK